MNRLQSLAVAGMLGAASAGYAQNQPVAYLLESGSTLTRVGCLPPCACPPHSFDYRLAGTFMSTLVERGPLFDDYLISDVRWTGSHPSGDVHITGSGHYYLGGEVALTQILRLDLTVNDELIPTLDSGFVIGLPQVEFPRLRLMAQNEQYACRQDFITFLAAPVPCAADWDHSGMVDSQDFFAFLESFFRGEADFNDDGFTNTQDFFDFLAAFFTGCG